jgi:glycerate kinase
MKIVIAPDSFKESLSAERTAQAIKNGFKQVFPDAHYICLPIADGGEGTVDAMIAATNGKRVELTVTGPQGTPVAAFYGVTGDGQTAVIEMAAASGLMLVEPEQRNPLLATSFGTGELIRDALDAGIRHIILGIGGSATVDGGVGMAQALGFHFYDEHSNELPAGGGGLMSLARVDRCHHDPRLEACRFDIACDVDNPLTGALGAVAVFGPQKGATDAMVAQLENGLLNYAVVLGTETGCDINAIVGGGAAGGMGVAAQIFLGGTMKPGIDIIMEAVGLDAALEGANLVITGEGRIDSQSVGGKAPIGVARAAQRHGVPVIGIAGVLGEGVEIVHQHGIDAVFSILPRLAPLSTVLSQGEINLQHCARNIAQVMKLGQVLAD